MTTTSLWRFSLLAVALPWAAVSACGGRTGDYAPPPLLEVGTGGGAAVGSGAATSSTSGVGVGEINTGPGVGGAVSTGVGSSARGASGGAVSSPGLPGAGATYGTGGFYEPGGTFVLPPLLGTGGVVTPPPFGAGGTFGTGGVSSAGSGGTMECFPPDGAVPEVCAAPGLPISTCCTTEGHCGVLLFPEGTTVSNIPLSGGCQQMNQPGYASSTCPNLTELLGEPGANATLPACCRLDGTCGLDLSVVGAGCVQSILGGKAVPCELPDGGALIDASPPAPPPVIVDSGVD
ncbi:MAG TPA: hypothetical protein VHC69_22435 [Polyangiaceae bacterium]|nr:hypothetical protein [Polyangiaceae bacterium]